MEATKRPANPGVTSCERLAADPWALDFYSTVRNLERLAPERAAVGATADASAAAVAFTAGPPPWRQGAGNGVAAIQLGAAGAPAAVTVPRPASSIKRARCPAT